MRQMQWKRITKKINKSKVKDQKKNARKCGVATSDKTDITEERHSVGQGNLETLVSWPPTWRGAPRRSEALKIRQEFQAVVRILLYNIVQKVNIGEMKCNVTDRLTALLFTENMNEMMAFNDLNIAQ